jgi:EAL domain-containing protein (putative c-di-GMP-specific phosphodiesterase class I)
MGYSLNVAVNLSPRNLHDPGLPVKVAGLLAKWGVPASNITLELTENAIMIDPERAFKILMRLHNMGIHLSIDDFGTGYSSLVYLKKLPVSQIKVDRSFVMEMIRDDDDAVIVQSTIDLGHNLSRQVVAEGVENKDTLERLKALGCDQVQGYYLSRPLPADEITAWFAQSNWGAPRSKSALDASQTSQTLSPRQALS